MAAKKVQGYLDHHRIGPLFEVGIANSNSKSCCARGSERLLWCSQTTGDRKQFPYHFGQLGS